MTAIVARLVLAMLLLPTSGAVFVLMMLVVVSQSPGGPPSVVGLAALWAVVYGFIAGYWLLLWRGVVAWTPWRVRWTAVGTIGSLALGVFVAAACLALNLQIPLAIAVLIGGGVVPIVWVLVTVYIWRETPQERSHRLSIGAAGGAAVACPLCGYSLAGLREARCPECGATFTLDQLLAAQRDQRTASEP